ncbi:uncharacterized protein LOC111579466 isoform X1 [Amphiprion ocellaris]|uniref:uncharacterized protein LOC111579466 isoform X1 n=1 Tax=Amphiprion ocellaris TaxID=80972 RepID=UPI002410F663|nr:uncharacterized protein LOC111579466 isoform X1 [Amphiprion ocellaris]
MANQSHMIRCSCKQDQIFLLNHKQSSKCYQKVLLASEVTNECGNSQLDYLFVFYDSSVVFHFLFIPRTSSYLCENREPEVLSAKECACGPVVLYTVHYQQQLHTRSHVLTSMAGWKLWLVLLLLWTCCTDSRVAGERLVKTIGKEPDVTPVCPDETLQTITVITCKISTERSIGEECNLTYQYGHDFEHGCDSRFSLIKENQTVFLRVSNLTPNDSGNYTCQCSYLEGTYTLHLSITVEGDEDGTTISSTETSFFFILTGVIVFVIIFGLILGFICRKTCHSRRQQLPITSLPNTETEEIEPYSVFMQKENVLYSTARPHSY